jgi:putative endopeptidase
MDEETIEQAGLKPMQAVLTMCDNIVEASQRDRIEYANLLGQLSAKYGIDPFFRLGASPDNKNSDLSLAQVSQGGIGLPDRDYYFDEDKEDKRVAYKKHMTKMLCLLEGKDEPMELMTHLIEAVYNLEARLACAHMTKTECRDPEATYNKMTLTELNLLGRGEFEFGAYLEGSTGKSPQELGEINVRNTKAIAQVAEEASEVQDNVLRTYLRWFAVKSCAPYLGKEFVMEQFDFYERILSGTDEIKPRWKRAMAFTETALGEALGKLYCAKYFDETCKGRALGIVENVRQALEERLKEVEWMTSDETRQAGLKKMSRFRVKIGYPDKWIDYSTLDIKKDDTFLTMVFKARAFEHKRQVKEMNAPTDRDKWVSESDGLTCAVSIRDTQH